jgi:hypothetical protein
MEPIELTEFQKIFASIDTSNPRELRRWFQSYPELTVTEHSQISGRTKSTIRTWKHKAKVSDLKIVELDDRVLSCKIKPPIHKMPHKLPPDIEIPPDWRRKPKWVAECYKSGISKRQLGFLLKCSRNKITKLIRMAENPIPQEILDFIRDL